MSSKKTWKIFTEIRADASGLVAVHEHRAGRVLRRTTSNGWLALVHSSETPTGWVTVDALRLTPDGPWPSWSVSAGGQAVEPEEFALTDSTPVSGGPDGAALRFMGLLGDSFGVHEHEGRVQLASARAVVSGPLDEWRPWTGYQVPESVLPVLALGPDEFEMSDESPLDAAPRFVIDAKTGTLYARGQSSGPSETRDFAPVLAQLSARVEGDGVLAADAKKAIKAGTCAWPAGVASAFGRLMIHEKGLGSATKLSAELAPGWVAAVVLS